MAIFVNVPHTTDASATADELHDATVAAWPIRSKTQILDVVAEIGNYIYGVRSNVIVAAYPIRSVAVNEHGRFVITTGHHHDTKHETRIGTALPTELAWKPGEQWPVKIHDVTALDATT